MTLFLIFLVGFFFDLFTLRRLGGTSLGLILAFYLLQWLSSNFGWWRKENGLRIKKD